MRKLFAAAIAALLCLAPVHAQNVPNSVITYGPAGPPNTNVPNWFISLAADNGSVSGVAQLVRWDTKNFDPSNICNVSSTWVCTPGVAGTYQVTCSTFPSGTVAGPSVGGLLGLTSIHKNGIGGTLIAQNYVTAQVAALPAGSGAIVQTTALVQLTSTDTIGCATATDAATAFVHGQTFRTYFTGYRTGP